MPIARYPAYGQALPREFVLRGFLFHVVKWLIFDRIKSAIQKNSTTE
jgi:hypothetical protein